MDRRKYLKTMAAGSVGAGLLMQCQPEKKDQAPAAAKELNYDRTAEEVAREKELMAEKFFDEHEMKTIATLSDIIIPKDNVSGSATDAGVPDFIEFMAKDRPQYQTPLRGGIKWLDLQCMRRFEADFASCTPEQQIQMVDDIAFPEKAKPEMLQGVAFFNTMRDLTACGFFTSKIGLEDLGYMGNRPNQWNGVPQEVLDQYGLSYDARTLEISAKYDS
ncbi:MAG TPA: gluconate 2-dehydrogenase subunit 3 family protein [Chryseosolibacter sp.]|nr:gluconate 2-dehydrogenase subunit 3 family protein [Chryseosolibacter sp.]